VSEVPNLPRARWILLLLLQGEGTQRYNKPVIGRTRLIKELFVLKMAYGVKDMEYEFIPYWYGPFCPEVYGDLQELKDEGKLESREGAGGEILSLMPDGVSAARQLETDASPDTIRRIRECKERFNSMPFEDFVAYVYERWPEYTTRALRSPSTVLEELRKQARKAKITEEDIDRAVAEYRAGTSSG